MEISKTDVMIPQCIVYTDIYDKTCRPIRDIMRVKYYHVIDGNGEEKKIDLYGSPSPEVTSSFNTIIEEILDSQELGRLYPYE